MKVYEVLHLHLHASNFRVRAAVLASKAVNRKHQRRLLVFLLISHDKVVSFLVLGKCKGEAGAITWVRQKKETGPGSVEQHLPAPATSELAGEACTSHFYCALFQVNEHQKKMTLHTIF